MINLDTVKQQVEQQLEQLGRFNPTKLDLTKFDVTKLDLTKFDVTKFDVRSMELPFELPKMELPKMQLPKFDLPKVELPFDLPELPKMELPKMELPKLDLPTERVAGLARDAAYVGVGATVVAVRAADERRKAVTEQVTTRIRRLVDTVA